MRLNTIIFMLTLCSVVMKNGTEGMRMEEGTGTIGTGVVVHQMELENSNC